MDLLRGMYTYIPQDYFSNYINRIEQDVTNKKEQLDRNKITEWNRLTLSLTSLGNIITNVAGFDFIQKYSESHK